MTTVNLGIKTSVDLQGVIQLKNQIKELQTMLKNPYGDSILSGSFSAKEIQQTINAVNALDRALDSAFDVNLNSINIDKFNKSLKNSNMNISTLYRDLSRMGVEGQKAFIRMTQANLSLGHSVKQTNALVDSMKTTLANTVKWGISSGLWNTMLQSVSKAFTYVKGLDKDLNDIRIVTGKSADQMERFAKQANRAAKDLAVSTRDYTQGALLYYQQGLSDKEVETRTNITAKASNVTGQDMSTVSEQLTAVWNGYQVANQAAKEGMDIYERYVDKMAAVAASTASDLEEQATAMSKVASAAYSMGVGFDELNAQISTIVSVTRQAPESVGTALKTIYARLGDLQVDGVDEFGVSLGDVSGKLQTMGIEVMDSNGQMREMDEVMTEVAGKWDTWTDAQKQAAAVAMAGKRQYNNLIALFDNWDMYGESLKTSMESAGTLSEQQSIALDSLENKMEQMQTSAEKFYDALFDEKSIGGLVDGLTKILDVVGSLTQGMGGLQTILPVVGGMMLKFFSKDIGTSLAKGVANLTTSNIEISNDKAKDELALQLGDKANFLNQPGGAATKEATDRQIEQYKILSKYKKIMTEEEMEQAQWLTQQQALVGEKYVEVQKEKDNLVKRNQLAKEYYQFIEASEEKEKNIREELEDKNNNMSQEERAEKENIIKDIQKTRENRTNDYIQSSLSQSEIANRFLEPTLDLSGVGDNSESIKQTINEGVGQDLFQGMEGADEKAAAFSERVTQELIKMKKAGKPVEEQLALIREEFSKLAQEGQEIDADNLRMVENALKDTETVANDAWEAIVSGNEALIGTGEEAQATIKKIETRFKELVKQGYSVEEAIEKTGIEIAEEADEAINLSNNLDQVENAQRRVNDATQQFGDTMALKNAISGISQFTGGLMTTVGALSGIFSAFQSATDTSLSSSERLKASIMGLSMSLPMLMQGFTQVTGGIKTFTGLTELSSLAQVKETLVTKGNAAAMQFFTNTKLGQILAQKLGIGVTTAETTAEVAETGATYGQAAANVVLQSTMVPLLAITLIIIAAIIALVAIIIAVTSAINAYTEKLEKNAQKANDNLEKQKELTEAAREEKKAIEEVTSAYEDLAKQYEDEEISLVELRNKTYDLCLQYEQEDLAVQTLTASYAKLNEIMGDAQDSADDALKRSLEAEQKLRTKAITRQFASDKGASSTFVDENGRKLDIENQYGNKMTWFIPFAGPVMGVKNAWKEQELADVLEKYDIKKDWTGKIDSEEFFSKAAVYFDDMLADLQDIDSEASRNLVNAMVENQDKLKENTEALKELKDYRAKDIASTIYNEDKNIGDINSAQDYDKVFDDIYNKLLNENAKIKKDDEKIFTSGADTEEERQKDIQEQAKQWVSSYLSGFEQSKSMGQRSSIIKTLQEKAGSNKENFSTESLNNKLANFSEAEFEFVTTNIDLAASYNSLDAFVNHYKETIDYLNSKNFNVQMKIVLEDEEITDSDIEEIYNNYDNFADKTGYDKEEFKLLDYSQQRTVMSQYYLDAQHQAIATRDTVVKAQEDELKATFDSLSSAQDKLTKSTKKLNDEESKKGKTTKASAKELKAAEKDVEKYKTTLTKLEKEVIASAKALGKTGKEIDQIKADFKEL